jgi:hypothetical protein
MKWQETPHETVEEMVYDRVSETVDGMAETPQETVNETDGL